MASETPPAYGTVDQAPPYSAVNPSEPPPSYNSLFGEVRRAKQESSGVAQFLKAVCMILLGTIGCTIFLGLMLALPVSMIVIGSIYINDCPAERYIPIYLIVMGCAGVIKNCSSLGQNIKNRKDDNRENNTKTNPIDGILSCFMLAWFIAGNVWVFRTNPTTENYCNPTCYYFAYWTILATYILLGLMCLCGCCAALFGALSDNKSEPAAGAQNEP